MISMHLFYYFDNINNILYFLITDVENLFCIITVTLQFESTSNILEPFLKITRRHLVAPYFKTSDRQKIVQRK